MKRIITILAFLFVAFSLTAQDKVISGYGLAGVTYAAAVPKVAAFNYVFQINAQTPYFYVLTIRQNDEGGVPADNQSTAYIQGSIDGTNYSNIDTVSYGGSGTYEVLTKSSWKAFTGSPLPAYTLPLAYKFIRVNITPTDTIWVKSIWLNVLPLK